MSHKATNWLSSLPAQDIGNSEFRVLFHLCDCHNPAQGCFPTQAYLRDACSVSNGTLNNALNSLEAKGLIKRHKMWDGKTKKQKPTRYILVFENSKAQAPSPKTGDGKQPKPTPKIGDGTDSILGGDPSPISGGSRLQPTGEVTCKEPVINQGKATGKPFFTHQERAEAQEIARHIKAGGGVDARHVSTRVRECLHAERMITASEASENGFAQLERV